MVSKRQISGGGFIVELNNNACVTDSAFLLPPEPTSLVESGPTGIGPTGKCTVARATPTA
jgi:hypothetical protein